MPNDRIDPRVTRTKNVLGDGLFELLQHNRWEKIRVQDILDHTGISRSAFYAHYGNKFELLIDRVPKLELSFDGEKPSFLELFEHVNEQAEFLRRLLGQEGIGTDILADTHRSLVASWSDYLAKTEHADDWMLPEILTGSLLTAIKAYVAQRTREEPADVSRRFDDYMERVLAIG